MEGKTVIYLALFSLCVIIVAFFVPTFDTNAFFGRTGSNTGMTKLIGGQIRCSVICTCQGTVGLRVGGPLGGNFIFAPGQSTLYEKRNIFTPSTWLLGTAGQQTQQCQIFTGESCEDAGCVSSGNTISIIGTS